MGHTVRTCAAITDRIQKRFNIAAVQYSNTNTPVRQRGPTGILRALVQQNRSLHEYSHILLCSLFKEVTRFRGGQRTEGNEPAGARVTKIICALHQSAVRRCTPTPIIASSQPALEGGQGETANPIPRGCFRRYQQKQYGVDTNLPQGRLAAQFLSHSGEHATGMYNM